LSVRTGGHVACPGFVVTVGNGVLAAASVALT
jgi:hypothetical protein